MTMAVATAQGMGGIALRARPRPRLLLPPPLWCVAEMQRLRGEKGQVQTRGGLLWRTMP